MMILRLLPVVIKQIVRHRTRSLLTIGGVTTAMFLFVAVQVMQQGVAEATELQAGDTTLIVYRKDRFCPATSRLPEYYGGRIGKLDGVRNVVPMKIVVNNCRTSLDVVTFRGVPRDKFLQTRAADLELIEGSIDEWKKRGDAAIIGETLAKRRGLSVGQQFDAAGIQAYVAGIARSDDPQDQNVAYVDLAGLQQAADKNLGVVTQFSVKVDDPAKLTDVAASIDDIFRAAEEPTETRSEKAFVAEAGADMVELVGFARYLGWGCLVAVLALVGNAIVLSVQDRIKEHAVLQTLGYTGWMIALLIVAEGVVLGVLGGLLGTLAALGTVEYFQYSLSTEGLSIPIQADFNLVLVGVGVSITLGILAGLVPAWQASRREIAACFRAV